MHFCVHYYLKNLQSTLSSTKLRLKAKLSNACDLEMPSCHIGQALQRKLNEGSSIVEKNHHGIIFVKSLKPTNKYILDSRAVKAAIRENLCFQVKLPDLPPCSTENGPI